MPLRTITDPAHVRRAAREYDRLGRDAFLARYGFGRSTEYLVEVDGRLYDSKALLGAAHQWASPDRRPLPHSAFSGGCTAAVRFLEGLGFAVHRVSDDALDVGRSAPAGPEAENAAVARAYVLTWNPHQFPWADLPSDLARVRAGSVAEWDWSAGNTRTIPVGARVFLLRQGEEPRGFFASGWTTRSVTVGPHWDAGRAARGDKASYVAFALETLLDPRPGRDALLDPRDFPPALAAAAHWAPFASGTAVAGEAAAALEALWATHTMGVPNLGSAGDRDLAPDVVGVEGAVLWGLVKHRARERALRRAKIEAVVTATGALRCEVPGCGFDFGAAYGPLGAGYAQVHHVRPLASRDGPAPTSLAELAVVCANCHVMLHHQVPDRGGTRALGALAVRPRPGAAGA